LKNCGIEHEFSQNRSQEIDPNFGESSQIYSQTYDESSGKSIDRTPKPRYSPNKHPHPSGSEPEFDQNLSDFSNQKSILSPSNIEFCINPQEIIQNVELSNF
jgi:hypothetical protein